MEYLIGTLGIENDYFLSPAAKMEAGMPGGHAKVLAMTFAIDLHKNPQPGISNALECSIVHRGGFEHEAIGGWKGDEPEPISFPSVARNPEDFYRFCKHHGLSGVAEARNASDGV